MYAIIHNNGFEMLMMSKRFTTYSAGITHIRRFFREDDGDCCIVVPVPEIPS